jgi:6-phosphofructokinase 1
MKRIAVLTSGGDAPGMNACLRAVVRTALAKGLEILGIRFGFDGLIRGDMAAIDRRTVANIISQGGTVLETSRCPEFETSQGRAKAINVLKQAEIEGLIIIGGNGSFHGATVMMKECKLSIVGIPGTIDNDVYGTDYSIGFDTAINCAIEAIDRIRDTALSLERLFFVEVMGHHTGFIALESGIAGGAEQLLIPESPMSIDELCSGLKESFKQGKKSAIVVVAEGKKPGGSFLIAQQVREKTGFDSRVCILGHVQRGGSPTARDRILASKLGAASVQALMSGKGGHMVGEIKGEIAYTPLKDTWQKVKNLNANLKELARLLSG